MGAWTTESCYSHPIRQLRNWKTATAIVTPRIYHCSCYAKVRKPLTHHPHSIQGAYDWTLEGCWENKTQHNTTQHSRG